ncbi:hypothetical protein E2C01_085055 [Portunus trituberculatus]|uniref:Uncharacterized protein n=1 Tax=Portunus trituberculatus TaxID=210409 RepID=A0A5B7JAY1_PORTR|nr:hypothetical protein [Portunus trituberculatus]
MPYILCLILSAE